MIRTAAGLIAALAKCKGGETIDESIEISEPVSLNSFVFAHPVTIHGARITSAAKLSADWSQMLSLTECAGLTFDRLEIEGQPKPERGFLGRGVTITRGADLTFTRSSFSRLWNGITAVGPKRLAVDSSDFAYIQTDGIIGQELIDFAAQANWFRKWFPLGDPTKDGDHGDAIQFHSNNGAKDDCDGALIKNNLFDLFPEDQAQGVWLSDPRFGGHRRVRIESNLLFSLMWNAIGVGGCVDPVLLDNRLLKLIGAAYDPRIRTDGIAAVLEGNEAPAYAFAKWGDAVPAGNIVNAAVSMAVIDAARDSWLAKFRPAAVPVPAPVPPATVPSPTAEAALAAKWRKAWDETHAATLALRRSETAMLSLADALGIPRP